MKLITLAIATILSFALFIVIDFDAQMKQIRKETKESTVAAMVARQIEKANMQRYLDTTSTRK